MEETQQQNIQLAERIQSQRQEIRQLLESLEGVVTDVGGAVKAIQEFDPDNSLRKEAERMDEEEVQESDYQLKQILNILQFLPGNTVARYITGMEYCVKVGTTNQYCMAEHIVREYRRPYYDSETIPELFPISEHSTLHWIVMVTIL
ncbi:hypothetical protein CIHG_04172 [Coccidioides immitis H538.4]|uniref:Uncharacterized protein n=1 Tax=Coccidioides immitis H538.4 TaxID=396776 RepID=A0A0J8UG56_COCIT|nr:hypothetical protein CIHG_04172 [Coccidioides immitis H538.4]